MEFNNDIYTIIDFQHVKPGKGNAFVRTKLRNLRTGRVLDNTFSAGEKIVTARVEKRPHQFLYKDDLGYHLMDSNTFEELVIAEEQIENADLIKDGQNLDVLMHAEKEVVLGCELPQFVELRITYTEPGIKGDTVNNTLKPAIMETGAKIQVPLFVDQDEMIRIDTRTRSYYERVKS